MHRPRVRRVRVFADCLSPPPPPPASVSASPLPFPPPPIPCTASQAAQVVTGHLSHAYRRRAPAWRDRAPAPLTSSFASSLWFGFARRKGNHKTSQSRKQNKEKHQIREENGHRRRPAKAGSAATLRGEGGEARAGTGEGSSRVVAGGDRRSGEGKRSRGARPGSTGAASRHQECRAIRPLTHLSVSLPPSSHLLRWGGSPHAQRHRSAHPPLLATSSDTTRVSRCLW